MNEDMSDMINNFKNMLNSDSVPDNIKDIMNNIKSNENKDFKNNETNSDVSSNISPEIISNLVNMFNSSDKKSETSNDDNSKNTTNIDFETLLKMKTIMEKMNSNKDDPRANLLLSLKPYLKESRKDKVEQYIKIFNISKVAEVFGASGGDKKK